MMSPTCHVEDGDRGRRLTIFILPTSDPDPKLFALEAPFNTDLFWELMYTSE
jgi:hypothetical protein